MCELQERLSGMACLGPVGFEALWGGSQTFTQNLHCSVKVGPPFQNPPAESYQSNP